MRTIPVSPQFALHQLFIVTCLTFIVISIGPTTVEADEVPAFFLKIAKNIPRVGRSDSQSKFEEFFLKNSKNIPRIGRRDGYTPLADSLAYSNPQHFAQLQKRMVSYSAPGDLNAVSWEHFPLSIEGPPELWRTLASYANDKYGSSSDDIDNELWQRDKRIGGSSSSI